jgi:hypothetical protein
MRDRFRVVFLALALAAAPASSLAMSGLTIHAGTLLVWSEESLAPELHGGPNPALSQLIGASLPVRFGVFFIEPFFELYGLEYEYINAENRAIPTDDVTAAGFLVLGGIASLQAGLAFPVTGRLSLGASVGLDAVVRFPLDLGPAASSTAAARELALAFFYDRGRFLFPETRLFLGWEISEAFSLSLNVRAFYPLFHAWDEQGLGFLDQFMLSAGLGFGVRLGGGRSAVEQDTGAVSAEPAPAGNRAP